MCPYSHGRVVYCIGMGFHMFSRGPVLLLSSISMRIRERRQFIRGKCPRLNSCSSRITRHHFLTYCVKPRWVNCYFYNKWARKLKKPFIHLQETATDAFIEQDNIQ